MSEEIPRDQDLRHRIAAHSRLDGPLERLAQRGKRAERPTSEEGRREESSTERRSSSDFQEQKARLQEKLLESLGQERVDATRTDVTDQLDRFVSRVLEEEDWVLNEDERRRLRDELREETIGLGPLAVLMADPAVTDILVNRHDLVFVERNGRLEKTRVRFRDEEHLRRVIERIAANVGRRIDLAQPTLDARLADGSRVNATLPPVSIDGPTLSIRRFGRRRLRRSQLQSLGMFDHRIATYLEYVVRGRQNVLIAGGTGSGKTTLLGALAEVIPEDERVVTIEDTAELVLDQEHVVRLETRPANVEGQGRITARDLVINSLRMRPDRILVGEVRGGEALDMLQAMNTGHDGGLSTIHANSPRDALSRLETMVLMAGMELPSRAIREQIVSALQVVVSVRRFEDGVRRIESVSEIAGLEGQTPLLNELFTFQRRGRRGRMIDGTFRPTGIVPALVEELARRDVHVPLHLFRAEDAGGGR